MTMARSSRLHAERADAPRVVWKLATKGLSNNEMGQLRSNTHALGARRPGLIRFGVNGLAEIEMCTLLQCRLPTRLEQTLSMKPLTAACLGFLILSLSGGVSLAEAPPTFDYDSTIKQGTAQLQHGSGELALAAGEAAIRAAPGRWEGHALLGRSLLSLKRFEPAADALSKAIELAPRCLAHLQLPRAG